jgi:hypothetical protein
MRKFLSENYISHHWVHIPLCGCKIEYTGKQGVLIPGFCFPNFIKRHKFFQGLARASKLQMYAFFVNQGINSLLSKDYRGTHKVYSMNA